MKKTTLITLLCAVGFTAFSQTGPAVPIEQTQNSASDQPVVREGAVGQPITVSVPPVVVPQSNYNITVMPNDPATAGGGQVSPAPQSQQPNQTQQPTQIQQPVQAYAQPTQPYTQPEQTYAQPAPTPDLSAQTPVPPERYYEAYPQPAYTGKTYRLQVGAYKSIVHAQNTYDALVLLTGLTPALETFGEYYRIVLPYVPAERVNEYTAILQNAGFSIWVREE